jgi:hypothetical protein
MALIVQTRISARRNVWQIGRRAIVAAPAVRNIQGSIDHLRSARRRALYLTCAWQEFHVGRDVAVVPKTDRRNRMLQSARGADSSPRAAGAQLHKAAIAYDRTAVSNGRRLDRQDPLRPVADGDGHAWMMTTQSSLGSPGQHGPGFGLSGREGIALRYSYIA